MASAPLHHLAVILLLFTLTTTTTVTITAVEYEELGSMLSVLRARGYNLFSNAIATSDIIYDVLAGNSFTFFAPTDSSLFTLDMTEMASDYISILRCHVIPLRIPFTDLIRFTSGSSSFPTLATAHQATIRARTTVSSTSFDDVITVDSVGVVLPGLFYSRNLAVHGLRGFLNCTSNQKSQPALPPVEEEHDAHPPLKEEHDAAHPRQVKKHRHVHPPPSDFSFPIDSRGSRNGGDTEAPSLSQANLPDFDLSNSPPFIVTKDKPLPSQFSNHIKPPSSDDLDNGTATPTEPELAVGGGFSPADSPAEFSPAYNLWLESPTSAPSSEPFPSPEFSENDDPTVFPPSADDAIENLGGHMLATDAELDPFNENEHTLIEKCRRQRIAVSEYASAASEEYMAGIKETGRVKSQPSDEATFDCPVSDGYDHASITPGYLYTRKPNIW